jgi:uncharacterized protein
MSGQIVHFEIPADDTASGRSFWGSLFGWQFEASPGPVEYHMTRTGEQTGGAITDMEPGKQGIRVYFDVDDINAGAVRVKELGGEAKNLARFPAWAGSQHARTPTATTLASGRTTRPRRRRPHRFSQRWRRPHPGRCAVDEMGA